MKQQVKGHKKVKTPLKKANKGQKGVRIPPSYKCEICKKGVNKIYCETEQTSRGFKVIKSMCERCYLG
jgi:hypothetical protein